MPLLDREEYIEQAYFFRAMGERMRMRVSTQELLEAIRDELLTTTKLPLALEYMAVELRHMGVIHTAMERMGHYFTPFQTYVVSEAEDDRGRFDFRVALEILRLEAEYRAKGCSPQGIFLYQFESICRNRLGYDRGLDAMAEDPIFSPEWREWILTVRRQIGLIDLADLLYVRSDFYRIDREKRGVALDGSGKQPLFGEKEGRIALANRRKDPLLLFSALQRQLGYPAVPRPKAIDENPDLIPALLRRVDRLETRLKFIEDEQRGGFDLSRFYAKPETESTDLGQPE